MSTEIETKTEHTAAVSVFPRQWQWKLWSVSCADKGETEKLSFHWKRATWPRFSWFMQKGKPGDFILKASHAWRAV